MYIKMLKSFQEDHFCLKKDCKYKIVYENNMVIYVLDENGEKVGLGKDSLGYIFYYEI